MLSLMYNVYGDVSSCFYVIVIRLYACAILPGAPNASRRYSVRTMKRNRSKLGRSGSSKHRKDRRTVIGSDPVGETWGGRSVAYVLFGLAVAVCLGYVYATHSKLLHENELWFSHISVSYE